MAKKNTVNKSNETEGTEGTEGYTIESGILIPKAKKTGSWDILKLLEVGQSFFIGGEDANIKARQAYQSAIKTHRIKVTQRSVTENGVDGVRIWRTA